MTGDPNAKPVGDKQAKPRPRHLSRIGAVQALYQMDLAGADAGDVIVEFRSHRFTPADETGDADTRDDDLAGGDIDFFQDLIEGVVRHQREIDPMIDEQLAEGWRLIRIDSILRAILRSGTYELLARKDVPPRVVINEYIDVGHSFFSDDEPRVINGVLDALAGKLRNVDETKTKHADVG